MSALSILLIEDSDADAGLVQAHLRAEPSFQITRMDTLADGCEFLRTAQTDAVILDLNLPDSIGLESFITIQRQYPEIPVIILSGLADEEMATAAVNRGAQDYVPKSDLDARILSRSLKYAIERNQRLLVERRNAAMHMDLSAARRVQQHLLPHTPPSISGYDVASICEPAEQTSGDFFDFVESANGTWDFLVADVSSHGFAPALIMVGARRVLRSCLHLHQCIGKALTITNHAVCEDTLEEQFVTLFLARLNPKTGLVAYTGAGHTAYLISKCGKTTTLASSKLPLGLEADLAYEVDGTLQLEPGDTLLLMTDGAWEAANPQGEQFGERRACELIHEGFGQPASVILTHLMESIRQHSQPHPLRDDVTIVLIQRLEQAPPAGSEMEHRLSQSVIDDTRR